MSLIGPQGLDLPSTLPAMAGWGGVEPSPGCATCRFSIAGDRLASNPQLALPTPGAVQGHYSTGWRVIRNEDLCMSNYELVSAPQTVICIHNSCTVKG